MQTVPDIIASLGGTSAVAAELGLTPSTVSSWKTSGRIPNWRRQSVLAMARKLGVGLDDATIEQAGAASSQAAAA